MAKTYTENKQKEYLSSSEDINNLLIPTNESLELDLISAIIQDSNLMKDVYYNIRVTDFSNKSAAIVYEKLRRLYEKKKKWNLTTLIAMFSGSTEASDALYHIPSDYIMRITDEMIETIKSKAIGRQLFIELYSLLQKNAESNDRSEVIANGLNLFSTLSQRLTSEDDTQATVLKRHKVLMQRRLSGELIGIPTGFPDLDSNLGQGFQKKDLIIIGARPSVGKTSFSLTLAHNIARRKFKVLYFTLEMDDEEVMDRLLAFQLNMQVSALVRGKVPKEKLREAYLKIAELPLTIRYMPKATSADIFSIAAKEKAVNGLDLIIVDYLGLLTDESEKRESEVTKIGRITKGLRAVAQMLDVAMVVPHQLNRQVERRGGKDGEDPMLSDLRDSGHIEQDADVIMFLSREIMNSPERAVLKIGKHRTGSTGRLDLRFNPLTTKFEPT